MWRVANGLENGPRRRGVTAETSLLIKTRQDRGRGSSFLEMCVTSLMDDRPHIN